MVAQKREALETDLAFYKKQALEAVARAEKAEADGIEALVAWRSLVTELWEGVRAHGLKAPKHGRDGERLIHAYCGAVASLLNDLDEAHRLLRDAPYRHSEECAPRTSSLLPIPCSCGVDDWRQAVLTALGRKR